MESVERTEGYNLGGTHSCTKLTMTTWDGELISPGKLNGIVRPYVEWNLQLHREDVRQSI